MGKIVAIGGGENGHHNTQYETGPFDKRIIELIDKTNPNFFVYWTCKSVSRLLF